MIKITDEIRKAIREAAGEFGSILRFSRELGIAHSTVLFWLSGKTRSIDMEIRTYKLYPALEPYLSDPRYKLQAKTFQMISPGHHRRNERKQFGVPQIHARQIPLLSMEMLKKINPMYSSMYDFVTENAEGMQLFACSDHCRYFALHIAHDNIGIEYMGHDMYALISIDDLSRNNDFVIAREAGSGDIVFRKFCKENDIVTLKEFSGSGKEKSWNCLEERTFLEWIYPICQIKFDINPHRNILE